MNDDVDQAGLADRQARPGALRRSFRLAARIIPPPTQAVNIEGIRAGGRFVGDLAKIIRTRPEPDQRIKVTASGQIDLAATAKEVGQPLKSMTQRVLQRRDETRRSATLYFWSAVLLLGIWTIEAVSMSWHGSRLLSALEFLPFCFALFAFAFRSAWVNWQLRVGRLGSLSEYLRTTEPFLPQ